MKTKYIVLIDSSNYEKIQDTIRNIADGYYIVGPNIALISFSEKQDISDLRDKIIGDNSGSVCIMQIYTSGAAAARGGTFTTSRNWEWIKNYCTYDIDEIKTKVIENYKKKEIETAEKNIPGASVRDADAGIGL